jgi:hypothetical protein
MSRFIAVIHGWHVHSNGFDVHEIEATEQQEANEKASYLTMQRQGDFDECAYVLVEVDADESINRPRKLTLRERLTGRTRP